MKISDFKESGPQLDIYEYFHGHSEAWGIFEDRFGNLRRQFHVDIHGEVKEGTLVLTENFKYSDGETDQRIWYINKKEDGSLEGRADDIIGVATGKISGNALNWVYEMNLKVGEGYWKVKFDDWMFLQDQHVLINKARVSRWNIEIGQVSIFFKRDGVSPSLD